MQGRIHLSSFFFTLQSHHSSNPICQACGVILKPVKCTDRESCHFSYGHMVTISTQIIYGSHPSHTHYDMDSHTQTPPPLSEIIGEPIYSFSVTSLLSSQPRGTFYYRVHSCWELCYLMVPHYMRCLWSSAIHKNSPRNT